MVKFLKRKLFIALFIFGGLFSFVLGLFSKSNIIILLIKSLLSALLFGAFGLGLDLFLISAIGEDEYERIFDFSSVSKIDKKVENSGKIDIKEEISEEEKKEYEDVFYQNKHYEEEPVESVEGESYTSQFSPAKEEIKGNISFETSQTPPSSNFMEESEKLKEMEKELKSSKRNEYTEGEVSFQVKNRRINTTPEVVAKAIKTILKRDEG